MATISQQPYTLGNSFKRKKYLKYDGGGPDLLEGYNGAIDQKTGKAVIGSTGSAKIDQGIIKGMGYAPMATGILDAFDSGNEFGRQSTGVATTKGALAGAQAGMALGPIGAGVGALVGGVTSLIGSNKAKKAEEEFKFRQKAREKQTEANYMQSKLGADPSLYQGNLKAQYFETGGSLSTKYLAGLKAYGGDLNQKSSDGIEVTGNSHDTGGVKLPQAGVEVEGGETAKDDYVFSEKLGFAKLHKPIMNAKGKIESKPYTVERKNAINLLNEQEDKLKFAQEFIKSRLNIE